MLSKDKLDRLNELARKAKKTPLSTEEHTERQQLREEYLENFRSGFRNHLEHIHVVDKDPRTLH